jgi:flagellar biosynthetic protein FliP
MIPETTSILTAFVALAAVLALVLGAARLVRLGGLAPRGTPGRLLAAEETLALDARRTLRLVRCGEARVVLLTGGASDLVVGWLPADGGRSVAGAAAAAEGPVPDAQQGREAQRRGGGRLLAIVLALLLFPVLAQAQSVAIDLGSAGQPGATSRLVQLTALITVLSLAPSLLVMVTAFTRIIIVLSLLRSALSTQGTPPNIVLIGLALFLSFFVMQPVLDAAWQTGLKPMTEGTLDEIEGMRLAMLPFHDFMIRNLRPEDLRFFLDLGQLPVPPTPDQAPWRAVVPAFLVGELRRAFEMGFLLFLPFLVIDMVVASVLMSLGMMMLPPNAVSLPFKLIFFVLVDGWRLVSGSLVQSFALG